MGAFAEWQPVYAAHGIATFPVVFVDNDKKPAVKGYLKLGSDLSRQHAQNPRFAEHDAFGFALGPRNRKSILDVDDPDEGVLRAALKRHGDTPFIVQTRDGFHAYYQHSGEPRRIKRPSDDLPIDILGGGFAVAPPSVGASRHYEIIRGDLDDLDRLPVMCGVEDLVPVTVRKDSMAVTGRATSEPGEKIGKGRRDDSLWRYCMKQATRCGSFDELLIEARTFNDELLMPPLSDAIVLSKARSAWGYEERGDNRFGQHGAYVSQSEIARLIDDQDVLLFLMFYRADQGPNARFMMPNSDADRLLWDRKRFARTRKRFEALGYVTMIRRPNSKDGPALYRWADKR